MISKQSNKTSIPQPNPLPYQQLYKNEKQLGSGRYGKVYKSLKLDQNNNSQYFATKQISCRSETRFQEIKQEIYIMQKIADYFKGISL